jgi:hypothetical protein
MDFFFPLGKTFLDDSYGEAALGATLTPQLKKDLPIKRGPASFSLKASESTSFLCVMRPIGQA